MKKAPITIFTLLALAMVAPAEEELKILSNVLINFGAGNENSYSDGWNTQAGEIYKSTQYPYGDYYAGKGQGLTTGTLYDTTDGSEADVNVSWNAGREGVSVTTRPVNPAGGSVDTGLDDVGSMNSIWNGMHQRDLGLSMVETCWQQKGKGFLFGTEVNLAYGDILIRGLETGATYTVSAVINVGETWSLGGDTVDGASSVISLSNNGSIVQSDCSFITTTQGTLELTDAGIINWEKLKDTSSFILTWVFKVSEDDTNIKLNVGSWWSDESYVGISAMGITQYDNSIQDVIGGIYDNADMVPEPSTATLSLLALTALAARRRRK